MTPSCGLILFFDWLCDVTVLFVGDFRFFSETSKNAGSRRGSDFAIPGIFENSGPKTNQNFTSGLSINVFLELSMKYTYGLTRLFLSKVGCVCPILDQMTNMLLFSTLVLFSSQRYNCSETIFYIKSRVIFWWRSNWIGNWNWTIWFKAGSFLDFKISQWHGPWLMVQSWAMIGRPIKRLGLFWTLAYSPI